MPFHTDGITRVRIRPAPGALSTGGPAAPGAVDVSWASTHEGLWHQVYLNGCLAGVTARPEDRRLLVAAPAGRDGPHAVLLAEVVAVAAADRWTDFAADLAGFAEAGTRVRLAWQAGPYLDAALAAFDVCGNGGAGPVDYGAPLNEQPLPAAPGGVAPYGYGSGGYGEGTYGQAAAPYEWTTDPLAPGAWRFAVVGIDEAGNRLAAAAEVDALVTPAPRPASGLRAAEYDAITRTATLAWTASPDV
jgi:hypothetical protein